MNHLDHGTMPVSLQNDLWMLQPDVTSHVRDKAILVIYREQFPQHLDPKLGPDTEDQLREVAKVQCRCGPG